jgi:hypothetical protein
LAERLNLEFGSLEPWMGTQLGQSMSPFVGGEVGLCVLRNRHSGLALVSRMVPDWIAAPTTTEIVIPASEGCHAFLMTADGLSTLPRRQVAGGVEVALPPALSVKVLLTHHSQVVGRVGRYLRLHGARANELSEEIARAEVLDLDRMISSKGGHGGEQAELRDSLHRLQGLLRPNEHASTVGSRGTTAQRLEVVFWELARLRRRLVAGDDVKQSRLAVDN